MSTISAGFENNKPLQSIVPDRRCAALPKSVTGSHLPHPVTSCGLHTYSERAEALVGDVVGGAQHLDRVIHVGHLEAGLDADALRQHLQSQLDDLCALAERTEPSRGP